MVEADADKPRKMIDIEQVLRLVPICERTVRRMEGRGTFPASRDLQADLVPM
jgi:hypothetical protein